MPKRKFNEILLWAGRKNGYLAWPGLAEAGLSGEKKWIPEKLESIFSPVRDIFFAPGRKMDSHVEMPGCFSHSLQLQLCPKQL